MSSIDAPGIPQLLASTAREQVTDNLTEVRSGTKAAKISAYQGENAEKL